MSTDGVGIRTLGAHVDVNATAVGSGAAFLNAFGARGTVGAAGGLGISILSSGGLVPWTCRCVGFRQLGRAETKGLPLFSSIVVVVFVVLASFSICRVGL